MQRAPEARADVDSDLVRSGEIIDDKYRAERVVGVGTFGFVVAARHLVLDEPVALKFLNPSLALHAAIKRQFYRDAKALRRLKSDHVVNVSDVGHHGGMPYLAMEYLQGETLADHLDLAGSLPVRDVVHWVLQACEALAEAHRLGIIHSDIKPENLFLHELPNGTDIVKVLDFGITKTSALTSSKKAAHSPLVTGAIDHMSPEQLTGAKQLDARTDIWAVGTTLFELLTGERPFAGADQAEVTKAILNAPPRSLKGLRPSLPAGLGSIVERCLEKSPSARYQTVAELAHDLSRFGAPDALGAADRVSGAWAARGPEWEATIVADMPEAGPTDAPPAGPKDTSYRVLFQLGEGGTARVFLAVSTGPERKNELLVLKTLRKSVARERRFVPMFVTEARIAARMRHPNVVEVHDVFKENGLPTLVMEYLEGMTLSSVLGQKRDRMPVDLHLWLICETLNGLQYAHDLVDYDGKPMHIVHRAVSPYNVFVTHSGHVKLLDFGIAKLQDAGAHTRTGVLKGKLEYMAPEQLQGDRSIDRRADLFAAGVMIWEAATRQRLWTGHAGPELMRQLLEGNIPRPTSVVPEIPLALEAICMKALSRDRNSRYQTAAELREALEGYLKSRMAQVSPWHASGFMQRHFKDQRDQVRARIQRLLNEPSPDEAEVPSDRRIHLRSRAPHAPGRRLSQRVAATRGGRWLSFIGGALTIGVLGWGVSWYRHRNDARAQNASVPAVPVPKPAAVTRVRVRIAAVPASARLYLDGQPLPTNPWELETAVDPGEHAILAWAEGFGAREARVTFDQDRDVVLELPRSKPVADIAPPRPPKPLPK